MTTLPNRPKTALLVVDVQNNVVARSPNRHQVVAMIGELVKRARAAHAAVVWVRHHDNGPLAKGTNGWRIVPELAPDTSESVIEKA